MIHKLLHTSIIAILVGTFLFACTENIPNCPTKMCILVNENGWQLMEVYEDGVKQTNDLSKYRIILTMPNATAPEGTFNRVNTLGNPDSGPWKTENNNRVLSLIPDNDINRKEPYIIDTFTPRQLVLILNRENSKTGPKQLRYLFEPL